MKVITYPLIPFTICFAIGIIISHLILIENFTIILLSLLFSSAILVYVKLEIKNKRKLTTLFGYLSYYIAIILGLLSSYLHNDLNSENHYSKIKNQNELQLVKGIITSNLKSTEKNTKHVIKITDIDSLRADGILLTYITKNTNHEFVPGDVIYFIKDFQQIPTNYNPFQFDYANYLKHQNIYHQVFLKENDFSYVKNIPNWNSFWFQLQKKLIDSFNFHHFDNDTQAIINSLLFGQRKLLDKEILTTYSNAGIIHILAISGLHVGIIYILLLRLLKPLKRVKKGNLIELGIILFFLWSFAVLTGLSASVTRAVAMFSIIAIGKYLNRNTNTFNTIAFSALVLLLFNPYFIFDVGFQMSYAAVLAIVAFYPFFKYFYFTKSKITKFFTDLILVSLAAQIGVLPLSIYYFNQFPLLFLFANIIVIPLTTIILWLGISTLMLNFIFPKLAVYVGNLLDFFISKMNAYANWISSFDDFVIKNISFNFNLCVICYLVILLFIFWCYTKKVKPFKWFLASIIVLQLGFLFTKLSTIATNEVVIFNSKETLISCKQNDKIDFYTNEIEANSENINHYKRGSFTDSIKIYPLQNIYAFGNKRILVIDSIYYPIKENPNLLLITNNAKINLERVIQETNPKQVVADNSNPYYKIAQWKATCMKRKIPFHATAEKGFYRLR